MYVNRRREKYNLICSPLQFKRVGYIGGRSGVGAEFAYCQRVSGVVSGGFLDRSAPPVTLLVLRLRIGLPGIKHPRNSTEVSVGGL
jgi:hypothetical protein